MDRRSFLLGASASGAAAASGVGFWRWQDITPTLLYPGREAGHALRDMAHTRAALPGPSAEYDADVVILGSGIAGLTTAWKLAREGFRNFILVAGPELHGNAASGLYAVGAESLRYPTGAHYLPLPSMESTHVREMLAAFGIITDGAITERPSFDERALVHAPDERLFVDGRWQEGLVPGGDVAGQGRSEGRSESDRFFALIETLRVARGADGRKVFAIPVAAASADPVWTALDRISFSAWLARENFVDPALHWYLDYCCRDDYGANAAQVSAWAGLHFFAARNGQAANAERGAVLTWPGGLAALATRLERAAFAMPSAAPSAATRGMTPRLIAGTAVSLRHVAGGVEASCVSAGPVASNFIVRARRAVSAMPLHVAAHVVDSMLADGYDTVLHAQPVASWMVANFMMNRFPEEEPGAELAWDNVLYGSDGLGYVVSTHQDIRVAPAAQTVFTAYRALADLAPDAARRWLQDASPSEIGELAARELRTVYGWRFAPCVARVEITLRGHAMATPAPGTLANAGLRALQAADGAVLYAHSDLSGYSVFEEAAWWGWRAAEKILAG